MRQGVDVAPLIKLDWISYMPAAFVSGKVSVSGQEVQLKNVLGYHDHNYGVYDRDASSNSNYTKNH